MKNLWKKILLMLELLLAVGLAAGCAHPQLLKLQTPRAEIIQSLGDPAAEVALPDGRTRLVYSLQPMAQEVYWVILDGQGRMESVTNVLNRKYFALVRPGADTEESVFRLFGPCVEKYTFHLSRQNAWMYRFLDDGFPMAFWVQFTYEGVVTETGYTLDPWNTRDGSFVSF